MTSRDRMHRCFFHQELDRPGVYFRTGYPRHDPTYDPIRAYIETHTDLRTDVPLMALESPPPVTTVRTSHSADFARDTATLHTPAGDLQASTLIGVGLLPSMPETFFIKTPQDVAAYLSLPLPTLHGDAAAFHAADRALGDRGLAVAFLGFNPAGTVVELLGSELFAEFSLAHRELLHALCQRQQEIVLCRLRHALALGIGPYFATLGQEYLVPPLHGPDDFRDFCTRYDRPIFDLIHNAGGRIHVHCHSRVAAVFDQFLELGTDILHPVEPPPMGDLLAAEAKRRAGRTLCLEGNIQIAYMYEHTPRQIADETAALIRDAFADRHNLIVSPTASLYQRQKGAECFAQVQALVQAVRSFRP